VHKKILHTLGNFITLLLGSNSGRGKVVVLDNVKIVIG